MVIIYNRKKNNEIKIDDTHHSVTIMPTDYDEEYPNILIELKNIDFERHAFKCDDCKALCDDFGTNTVDWFVEWKNKNYRLNLSNLGNKRDQMLVSWTVSHYFTGTRLKLMISTESVESLEKDLNENLELENYEHCVFLRDRIEQLKN